MYYYLEYFLIISLLLIDIFTSNFLAIKLALNNAVFTTFLKNIIFYNIIPNITLNAVDNIYFNTLFAEKNNNFSILLLNIEKL